VSVQSTPHTASTTAIAGIDLVGCVVADFQRSLAFYRDTLGMAPSMVAEGGAEFHLPDGTTFGLWQPPESEGMKPHFSVMFTVADAAGAAEHIRERGGTIEGPFESPVCHMAIGKDPDDNSVIVHQKKTRDEHKPSSQARTLTTIHGIDLAGFFATDPDRAIAFYRDTLGLAPTNITPGRGSEFELADGSTFGVWSMPNTPPGGFVMFAVDDARAKAAELRSRDMQLTDVVETPNCFMAWGPDPEGNSVIIHQRKRHG
jgi:predicted enzyme related to lactoylglutathione lyase